MTAIFHHVNILIGPAAHHVFVIVLLAVTLCFVVPFFLVIATVGAAGDGATALGSRWHGRRRRRYGARDSYRDSVRKRTRLE